MDTKQRCVYRQLENGIHEFVFLESSNRAVDEFIAHLDGVVPMLDASPNGISRTLMDTRQSGALPMYYTFKKFMEWHNRQSEANKNRAIRTAQLYKGSSVYESIARNLMKAFPKSGIRQEHFQNNREAALAWLLSND